MERAVEGSYQIYIIIVRSHRNANLWKLLTKKFADFPTITYPFLIYFPVCAVRL